MYTFVRIHLLRLRSINKSFRSKSNQVCWPYCVALATASKSTSSPRPPPTRTIRSPARHVQVRNYPCLLRARPNARGRWLHRARRPRLVCSQPVPSLARARGSDRALRPRGFRRRLPPRTWTSRTSPSITTSSSSSFSRCPFSGWRLPACPSSSPASSACVSRFYPWCNSLKVL